MIDQDKIREAVRLLLEGIGEDPRREGLIETPDRVARMYTELFSGMDADVSKLCPEYFPWAMGQTRLSWKRETVVVSWKTNA